MIGRCHLTSEFNKQWHRLQWNGEQFNSMQYAVPVNLFCVMYKHDHILFLCSLIILSFLELPTCSFNSVTPVKHNSFSREKISVGTNPNGLPEACGQDRTSGTGRSTPRGSDRSSCRRWATSLAKAWGRTLKVCGSYETSV